MPLTADDWGQIYKVLQSEIQRNKSGMIQSVVTKRDTDNKLIWVKELGDQPIPLIAFDHDVKYYIVDASNNTVPRHGTGKVKVPEIGEAVLILLHMGTRRLPKALGVIRSTNFVIEED
jgi:hypothetical protein